MVHGIFNDQEQKLLSQNYPKYQKAVAFVRIGNVFQIIPKENERNTATHSPMLVVSHCSWQQSRSIYALDTNSI